MDKDVLFCFYSKRKLCYKRQFPVEFLVHSITHVIKICREIGNTDTLCHLHISVYRAVCKPFEKLFLFIVKRHTRYHSIIVTLDTYAFFVAG